MTPSNKISHKLFFEIPLGKFRFISLGTFGMKRRRVSRNFSLKSFRGRSHGHLRASPSPSPTVCLQDCYLSRVLTELKTLIANTGGSIREVQI